MNQHGLCGSWHTVSEYYAGQKTQTQWLGGRVSMKVRFPDGTVVTACSLEERRESDPDRVRPLHGHRVATNMGCTRNRMGGLRPAYRPVQAARSIAAASSGLRQGNELRSAAWEDLAGQVRCSLAWQCWQAYPSAKLCDGSEQTIAAEPARAPGRNAGLSGSPSKS